MNRMFSILLTILGILAFAACAKTEFRGTSNDGRFQAGLDAGDGDDFDIDHDSAGNDSGLFGDGGDAGDAGDRDGDDAGDGGDSDGEDSGDSDSDGGDDVDGDGGDSDGEGDIDGGGDDSEDDPQDLITLEDGRRVARPDYEGCAALPDAGRQGYGQCEDNSVVVIVNDGESRRMTCCPIGKNVLSDDRDDLFVERNGTCRDDEVLTGMIDVSGGIYCSKINTKALELSAARNSLYTKGNAPGPLGAIAAVYHANDTCICEENTMAIGGHIATDNACGEMCVELVEK